MIRPVTSRHTAHDTGRRVWMTSCLLLMIMAGGAPATAERQQEVPTDSPWLPWLGCWQLVEETGALAEQANDAGLFADRVVVCLTLTGTTGADAGGVSVTTFAAGTPVLIETLLADGAQHAVAEAACSGWRRNSWSSDGVRLFTRAELGCDDQDTRRVSGVGLMTSATTWLDIELVNSGTRGEVTVRRYRRAGESTTVDAGATHLPAGVLDRARTAARLASTTELRVDDVIEAGAALDPPVVEAMLVETRASFALDRRALIRLDDGGVPPEVIDLMVALSFPNEFVVDRPAARTAATFGGAGGGFADRFSPYAYDQWYPYYASPFGYYYGWSPYDSLYYLGPAASYVIVPDAPDQRSSGRAYRGRGYSQIGVREPSADRRARRRGATGTGEAEPQAASRGGSNSSGSSRGGQATPSGYSRGGSSGRTAIPRNR